MSYYHNTMSSPFNRIPDLVFYVRLLIVLTFCTFAKLITIFPHTCGGEGLAHKEATTRNRIQQL